MCLTQMHWCCIYTEPQYTIENKQHIKTFCEEEVYLPQLWIELSMQSLPEILPRRSVRVQSLSFSENFVKP